MPPIVTSPADESRGPHPLEAAALELTRHWRILTGLPLLVGLLAIGAALVVPKKYDGVTIFSPSQQVASKLPSNLLSIAASFGITAGEGGYSVYYFSEILQSREALRLVASDTLVIGGKRLAVLDALAVSDANPTRRLERGIKRLKSWLTVRTDDQAKLVALHVLGPSPEVATALAEAFLRAVNTIALASLTSGGSFEWRFAQAQADSALDALRQAEDALLSFQTANRSVISSPALQVEEARLQRGIQIKRDIYVTLVQQAEAAKLQAARNTPAVSIVQPPQSSSEKASPQLSVWALTGVLGTLTLVLSWLYIIEPVLPASIRGSLRAASPAAVGSPHLEQGVRPEPMRRR